MMTALLGVAVGSTAFLLVHRALRSRCPIPGCRSRHRKAT